MRGLQKIRLLGNKSSDDPRIFLMEELEDSSLEYRRLYLN